MKKGLKPFDFPIDQYADFTPSREFFPDEEGTET